MCVLKVSQGPADQRETPAAVAGAWDLLFASAVLSYRSCTAEQSSFPLVSEDALDTEHLTLNETGLVKHWKIIADKCLWQFVNKQEIIESEGHACVFESKCKY